MHWYMVCMCTPSQKVWLECLCGWQSNDNHRAVNIIIICWHLLHCGNINKPTAGHYHTVIHFSSYTHVLTGSHSRADEAMSSQPSASSFSAHQNVQRSWFNLLPLGSCNFAYKQQEMFYYGPWSYQSISSFMVIETSKFMFKVCKVLQTFTEILGTLCSRFKKRGGKGMALQSALSRLRTAASSQSLPPTERRLNNHVLSAVRNAVC